MLEVKQRQGRAVTRAEQRTDGMYFYTEAGILRLAPQSDRIIRVMYTAGSEFTEEYGIGIVYRPEAVSWSAEETEEAYLVKTAEITAEVNKQTSSIRYLNAEGRLLLAEKERESRILEEFDSYRMVIDENTKVDLVETPDGVKRMIREANKEFDRKLYHTRLFLDWQEDEALFGLGQAEEGILNLRGTTQYIHQANLKIGIPMLLSTKGYGILLATGSPAVFNDTQYGSYLYTEADPQMDFYFIKGDNFDEIISGYRLLSGKAAMLPKWAFGFIQSQERYETQEEILAVAKEYRERGIGLDCIVLDWHSWKGNLWGQKTFDLDRFPDPAAMTKELHDRNVHFMLSMWPNMHEASENYREFFERKLLLPASNIYDAFRKEARELYWKQVEEGLFCYGVDAWWCDSSEPVTPEWGRKQKPEPFDMYREFTEQAGKYMPLERCSAYGLAHAGTMFEGQRSVDESRRVVNLTRSGYTGSQRYGTILWSGDIYASWETLRRQIASGLNFCASGLPYWTLDIGGFFVKRGVQWFWAGDYDQGTEDLGYRELFTRWFQYGAFLPVFRSHGTDVRREIWQFGEPGTMFYDALVRMNRLRYRLMPYIYSAAGDCWRKDGTMMRMLAFDFAEDEKALEVTDQYLFGRSLMVCPVTEPMYYEAGSVPIEGASKTRRVYLPAGEAWYDFWTNVRYEGGQTITADAGIDRIPLYVREGSIIPMAQEGEYAAEQEDGVTELRVYPGKDAEYELYEDAGDGYGYEKGEYCVMKLCWDDEKKALTFKERQGNYPGKKEKRQYKMTVADPSEPFII